MHLKRPELSSSPERAGGSYAATAEDLARWPAIVEFVSAAQWPDGTARAPGSLVMFVEDGRLKVCLNDKDQGAVCFVTARSLLELLDAVETILCNGKGDWRASKPIRNGRK
jgi:hypothetical protein